MIPKLFSIPFFYLSSAILISGEPPPKPPTPIEEALYLHRYPEPYAKIGADSSIKIIRPTFFIYLRDRSFTMVDLYDNLISRMVQIVNDARSKEYLYDSKHLDPWVENIVIIEEDDHWVVAFHPRGNKRIARKVEGVYKFSLFLTRGYQPYYLSKSPLELIEKPEGSLTAAPTSFFASNFQHPLKVSTNYPDDNVDSFMNIDEIFRINREWLEEMGQLGEDKSQTDD